MLTNINEVLKEGSATQHTMVEGVICIKSQALRCRDKTIASKTACNQYECPYHPFDMSDHWG